MMKDSKAKIAGGVIAILGLGLFSFAFAVGIWSLTTGGSCGTSGDDKCIDMTGTADTDYVNIYYREVDGARFCEKTVGDANDFGSIASPYALVGGCGLGDWPAVDFQVIVHEQANVCDGFDIEACAGVSGAVIGICASYPGGVYAAFTLQDCIAGGSGEPAGGTVVYEDDLGTLLMLFFWTMMIVLMLILMLIPMLLIGFRNVFRPLK